MHAPACRHCAAIDLDAKMSYAARILLAPDQTLRSMVEKLEAEIRPGVTAVCPECDRVSIITQDGSAGAFAHTLGLWRVFGPFLDGLGHDASRKSPGGDGAQVDGGHLQGDG